jgi:hypothetical protein
VKTAGVAFCFVLFAIAATWPLILNLPRASSDPGDPYLNAFILDWDAYALTHAPSQLFDAPIFFPAKDALAFSENMVGIAILFLPLRWLGLGALTIYNLALLLGYAFSGFGMYLLMRHVTKSHAAAFVSGLIFGFIPWRFVQASHLQHVWSGWLPLALLAVLRLAEAPSFRRGVALFVCLWFLGASNIHWLLMGGFALAATVIVLLWRTGNPACPDRQDCLSSIALSVAAAILCLLPLLIPYARAAKRYGMTRNAAETLAYSALPSDWLAHAPPVDPERWLFPGFTPLLLAIAGLVLARGPFRYVFLLWIVIGVLGSFGLHAFFHRALFDWVYPFRAIRVPARWANIAYLGMAGLGGLALSRVRHRSYVIAIALLVMLELRAAPIRWYLGTGDRLPVYDWLARMPADVSVLELPISAADSDFEYELASTIHHHPIVNGASGFSTPAYDRLLADFRQSPISPSALDELRASGVRLLIVHADSLGDDSRKIAAFLSDACKSGRLQPLRQFDNGLQGDFVFAISRCSGGEAILPARTGKIACPPSVSAAIAREVEHDPWHRTEQFLTTGLPSYSDNIICMLDTLRPGQRVRGRLHLAGWALSPLGVREVNVAFNNGLVVYRAQPRPIPALARGFPWFAWQVDRAGYVLDFADKPRGVWRETDVQLEVVDGEGRRRRFPTMWITWD